MDPGPRQPRRPLLQLAGYFLRLGLIGFGGPPAHIALMRRELVDQRKWITPDQFNEALGTANLLPGPTSTEMTIYIGHRLGGVSGAIVSGACFILPAMLIVLALSVAYTAFGVLPATQALFYGVKPVALALVIAGTVQLGRSLMDDWRSWAVFGLALALLMFTGIDVLVLFVAAGVAMLALSRRLSTASPALIALTQAAAAAPDIGLLAQLLLVFLKIGVIIYGGGFALVGLLQQEVVVARGWLTEPQFLDAIAVGQSTPGPVFTTATFVGYLVGGAPGAILATIGIFAPAFALVLAENTLFGGLKRSATARAFLRGVNAAVVATIALAAAQLARGALIDAVTVVVAGMALWILLRKNIGAHWLILAGIGVGVARAVFG